MIISGPSGVGKDTVIGYLTRQYNWQRYPTCTTRPKRIGEFNGIDYYFIKEKEFFKMRRNGYLLDCVCISGYYYGFPLNGLIDKVKNENYVVNLIAESGLILKNIIKDTTLIYLTFPSRKVQIKRLSSRGMTQWEINLRLKDDPNEWRKPPYYDVELVNFNSRITAKLINNLIIEKQLVVA